jgi:exportin-1
MYAANCARLLVNYLTLHGTHLETPEDLYWLEHAHAWLLKFTAIPEQDIFKLCIAYWLKLARGLYQEVMDAPPGPDGLIPGLSMGASRQETEPAEGNSPNKTRNAMYAIILTNLRVLLTERMVKPEEVSRRLSILYFLYALLNFELIDCHNVQ